MDGKTTHAFYGIFIQHFFDNKKCADAEKGKGFQYGEDDLEKNITVHFTVCDLSGMIVGFIKNL